MPEENLTAKITVDTSQVTKAVSKAKRELAKLHDKTVTVKVRTQAARGGASSGGGGSRGGDKRAFDAARAIAILGRNSNNTAINLKDLSATARILRRSLENLRNSAKELNKAMRKVNHTANKGAEDKGKNGENNSNNNNNNSGNAKQKEEQQSTLTLRKFTKALVATIAAAALAREAYKKLAGGLKTAADYQYASLTTGISVERLGQWKFALSPYGGGDAGAVGDMMALQRNLEEARRGKDPFSTDARQLMGDSLNVRPGMTQEEFINQIAPQLQQLKLDEALRAGRDIGLSDAMIHFLRKNGADWQKALEEQKPIINSEEAQKAAKTKRATERVSEYSDKMLTQVANRLLGWLDKNPSMQQYLGAGGTIASFLADATTKICTAIIGWKLLAGGAKAALAGGAKAAGGAAVTAGGAKAAGAAVGGAKAAGAAAAGTAGSVAATIGGIAAAVMATVAAGIASVTAGALWGRDALQRGGVMPPDNEIKTPDGKPVGTYVPVGHDKESAADKDVRDMKRQMRYQQLLEEGNSEEEIQKKLKTEGLASNTPLNYMDNNSARQLGAAVGRGETSVDVGGVIININAPTGNAHDIQNAVARGNAGAAEVVRQEFEKIDRENASNIIA